MLNWIHYFFLNGEITHQCYCFVLLCLTMFIQMGSSFRNFWFNQVGILDVDLCGPSIPRMLSMGRPDVHQCDSGWVPVYTDTQKSLALMSIGFLLEDPDEAVVWRGPKKNGIC